MLLIFSVLMSVSFITILFLTRTRPEQKTAQQRMDLLVKRESHEEANAEALRQEKPQSLSQRLTERFRSYAFAASLEQLIVHSGSKTTLGSFVLTSLALAVGVGFALNVLVGALPLTLIGAVVGGAANYFLLKLKKSRRIKKFNEALPDGIELMARALRAGHAMPSAIEIVSEQSAEPLAGEFAICFQQQKFGIPFRDALLTMGERVPSKDLHFLITAILVQKETGGDLTEILDRTTEVIRERVRIEGEVRTYTAQGRLTGWILSGMPVAMLGLISFISPSYSKVLFHDPLGQDLLYGAAGLIVLGGFIISKIVDIKV